MVAVSAPDVGSQDFRASIALDAILHIAAVEYEIRLGSSHSH